jgi:pimeloyl-ACP methyl ester carboxylesterase
MCSYRSRREWASHLAAAGFATLRIDFPGSGDSSGGPRDPERLRAWTDAVGACARWLSGTTGARRVVAVGIGLGGAIAYRALALGAPIDDLVLWGVSARGRKHVRELRAFSYLESPFGEADTTTAVAEDPADGSLVVAGYVMSPETQRELDELDLAELDCRRLDSARVLMLERDGRAVDARLQATIEGCGAEVTVSAGDGYAAMMMAELPHAVSAHAVFETVSCWLTAADTREQDTQRQDPPDVLSTRAQASNGAARASEIQAAAKTREPASDTITRSDREGPAEASCAEISMPDGKRVRETPITISHPLGDPLGILAEPLGPALGLCAIWLNAGPQRRIGPNRMWVETARRWAALGVPTFRVDLAAIGDAEGDSRPLLQVSSYYTSDYLEQVRLVLDTLQARGLPPRFVLGGLCAGGYWALRVAQEDSRVSATASLNPGYLVYDGGLSNAIGMSRGVLSNLRRGATWKRLLRGQVTPSAHLAALRTLLAGLCRTLLRLPARVLRREADDDLTRAFNRLKEQDQRALVLFAGEERLYTNLLTTGRLAGLDRWPNISVQHIEVAGDMHTLRPLNLQREAHQLVDELLERELELIGAETVG